MLLDLGLFRSRLFHAKGVGLRGGGLTGRRAVALAAPLRRGCLGPTADRAMFLQPYGTISRGAKNNRATSEARPSGRRPVRAPPRRPAHQRGIAVSETNPNPTTAKPHRTAPAKQHQPALNRATITRTPRADTISASHPPPAPHRAHRERPSSGDLHRLPRGNSRVAGKP